MALSRLAEAARFARTVRHLRPAQIGHRIRLRTQRALLGRAPGPSQTLLSRGYPPAHGGWPEAFGPLDSRVSTPWPPPGLLGSGQIRLLGEDAPIGDWSGLGQPLLWRFHLHYWDWAWPLAATRDQRLYARLFESWRNHTTFGRGEAWAPYVASLRAWSWCGQFGPLVRGTPAESAFAAALWEHTGFLRAHLELDVGGNHLVKNLKALVGLAVFFGDQALVSATMSRLEQAVAVQVLSDGGHYELAPSYHCQVLGDLLDVSGLLAAVGQSPPDWLTGATSRMRDFLGLVLLPDGTVPLFNDGYPVPPDVLAVLEPGPPALPGATRLPDTGLVALRMGQLFVLADVGRPCPEHLPAHAHADTLSFLLYDGDQRIVTETGTSTYDPGARRDAERSTRAHSTVEIDGTDSTEVWGAFRAGHRARVNLIDCSLDGAALVLTAEHDGYRRVPGSPVHRRTWRLTPQRLDVLDEVTGSGTHHVTVRLILDPGRESSSEQSFGGGWQTYLTEIAEGWQRLALARVLHRRQSVTLPWSHEFSYRRDGAQ